MITNFFKSTATKVALGFMVFGVVFAGANSAKALTMAELDAYIAKGFTAQWIMANVSGASSSSSSSSSMSSYDFGTATLREGSKGTYVSNLQMFLNSTMSAGLSTDGNFGAMTKAKVASWQAANGLTADGVFGSASMAKAKGTTTTTTTTTNTTTTTGTLSGGAGAVDSYELLSSYSNEDVGEGEEEVIIMGFEVEADNGSDLSFSSMKVSFVNSDTGSSEDLADYATEVSIWLGDKKVGEADVDDFSESSDVYTKTITLSNAIVESDETEKFYVAISAVSSIDSADSDSDSWSVDVTSARFVDAQGAVLSEDPTLAETEFDFGTFADAADIEMKVALHNDSPDAGVVEVDTSSDTNGVELLKFTIEAEGTDITIADLPILLTAGGSTDVDTIVNSLVLKADGEEWSETVSSSTAYATITFDDIDFTIDEGDKVTFTVYADINDIEASSFDEGDTLKAELTATMIDAIDADDQEGDSISDTDATGTALGDALAFYSTGIMVTLVSADESVTAGSGATDDIGTFTIKYKVEAFGGSVTVSDTATATIGTSFSTVPSNQVLYSAVQGSTATASGLSGLVTFTTSNGATDSGITNGVQLEEGEYADFTLTVSRTNNTTLLGSGIWQVLLKGISWATSDTATQNVYTFDLEDYKTDPVALN